MTDACENIAFPQLLLRTLMKEFGPGARVPGAPLDPPLVNLKFSGTASSYPPTLWRTCTYSSSEHVQATAYPTQMFRLLVADSN